VGEKFKEEEACGRPEWKNKNKPIRGQGYSGMGPQVKGRDLKKRKAITGTTPLLPAGRDRGKLMDKFRILKLPLAFSES
jgi:hypothetical protein